SSRRRHTRFSRDWSSDVCSSDLFVAAYDLDGNLKWKVQPGEFSSIHGYSSPPVLFEDKVIVNGDHDGNSYLVALDKTTGETLWRSEERRVGKECRSGGSRRHEKE